MSHAFDWPATVNNDPGPGGTARRKPWSRRSIAPALSGPVKGADLPVYSLHEAALSHLDGAIVTLTRDQGDEAVHAVRKACKRVRAALRLLRERLGPLVYPRENRRVRDAAKPLTAIRDAFMLQRALSTLPARSEALQRSLESEYRRHRHALAHRGVLSVLEQLMATRQKLVSLPPIDLEVSSAIAGVRRTYKAGREAFSKARSRDDHALHEWRKQANYLLNQLKLLKKAFNAEFTKLRRQADRLAKTLGDDHDLGVLIEKLCSHERDESALMSHIKKRRGTLQARAFRLGKQLYRDPPEHLEATIRARLWSSNKL